MSSRKAKHGKRRTRKARHAGHRLSNEDIENVRLPLLGEDDPEFSMAEYRRPHVSRERRE
jgi:hypothetical protein